jgi:hypothetical protein
MLSGYDESDSNPSGCVVNKKKMFRVNHHLSHTERHLLHRLESEYTPALLKSVLLPLVTQTSPVSLRVLDWAVVNWSKCHNIICSAPTAGVVVNMYQSYRRTLLYWKRRLFDPFRRRQRIGVFIDEAWHETTLGQANFALWSYQTGTLAYVLGHVKEIEKHMNTLSKKHKRERALAVRSGATRKRTELTKALPLTCIAYIAPCKVDFL